MARRRRTRRLKWVAGLLTGLVLLAGFAVWKLSQGPVSVDFLAKEIERTLNSEKLPVTIDLGRVGLAWGGWSEALQIVLRDVTVASREGGNKATLSQIAIDFNPAELLYAIIAPTRIDILKPDLYVHRQYDGKFGIILPGNTAGEAVRDGFSEDEGVSVGASAPDFQVDKQIFAAMAKASVLLKELQNIRGEFFTLEYLESVSMREATVNYDDFKSRKRWRGDDFKLALTKGLKRSIVDISGRISTGDKKADIASTIYQPLEAGPLDFEAEIAQADGAFFSSMFPEWEPFIGLASEMAAKVQGAYDVEKETLVANAAIVTAAGDVEVMVDADLSSGLLKSNFVSTGVDVKQAAGFGTALKDIKRVQAIIGLDLAFDVDMGKGVMIKADARIAAEKGRINLPEFYEDSLIFSNFEAEINSTKDFQSISIPRLDFRTEEFEMSAQASISPDQTGDKGPLDLTLKAVGSDFDMGYLDRYWPAPLAPNARRWVIAHIPQGNIPSASLDMSATYDPSTGKFALNDMGGEIYMTEAVVEYLAPLPEAYEVEAVARYGMDWFDIEIKSGETGNIKLRDGKILLGALGTKNNASIKLPITTPVKDGLEFLDQEPFGFITRSGLGKDAVTGMAAGIVELNFQLRKDLKKEDVKVKAEADLSNLQIMHMVPGNVLTADKMKLFVSENNLRAYGKLWIGDDPFDVDYFEYFKADNAVQRKYVLSGNLRDEFLFRQGFAVYPHMQGAFDVSLVVEENFEGKKTIAGNADLTDAALLLPFHNWHKPYTIPASATFTISQQNQGEVIIDDLNFVSDDLEMGLSAVLSPDMKTLRILDIEHLLAQDTDIKLLLEIKDNHHFDLRITGDKFDATGALDQIFSRGLGGGDDRKTSATIELYLEQLTLEPKRKLANLRMVLQHTGEELDQVSLYAKLSDGADVRFNYGPDVEPYVDTATKGRNFILATPSLGRVLADLNLYDKMEGGNALIVGHEAFDTDHIDGKLFVDKYVARDTPVLARLLEAVSLTGLPRALSGNDMQFNKAEGDFRMDDGVFRIKKIRTYNNSVGLTFDGIYDLNNNVIDLHGTVVPAYGMNKLIGNIPLLGWILTGGDGGGLFGATFYITGGIGNQNVTVNPLSIITPGVLRRIFDFSETDYEPLPESTPER